jgi:transposase InsO family protein
MTRRDNHYDNAQAESLFSRFKAELLEDGVFLDVEDAKQESFDYIEGYYNTVRRHSSLGNKSPLNFERAWRAQSTAKKNDD